MYLRDFFKLRLLSNVKKEYNGSQIQGVINQLEENLVGLKSVKSKIRKIAILLLIQHLGSKLGVKKGLVRTGLHMSFTGNPSTGKTEVSKRVANLLFKLGYTGT